MDTLYIGDIPLTYKYANLSNDYIDLYDTDTLIANNTYTRYRIYMYDNSFMYSVASVRAGATQSIATELNVTNNVLYRRDMPFIAVWSFVLIVGFVFLINIVTSFIKKGGVFGGLL